MLEHKDLLLLHDNISGYFSDKWEKATKYEKLKQGKHWTASEIESIKKQNRDPFSFPIIAQKLNTIIATQRGTRTEWKVLATYDPADEIKAEMANIVLKHKEKIAKFKYIESEVFDAGLSINCGVCEILTMPTYLGDTVTVKQLDHRNVVWDINSREYDLADASFIAKVERMYRRDVAMEYGDEAATHHSDFMYGRPKIDYYVSRDAQGRQEYDLISVVTHYQKVMRNYYAVVFPDYQNRGGQGTKELIGMYRSKKEAEQELERLRKLYLFERESIEGDVVRVKRTGIDKYVFTYNDIISKEELDDENFPIVVYRSFHFQDDYWTLTDILYDSQKFFDKLYMQIDYSFGRDVKNVFEGDAMLLAEGETPQSAVEKMNKGGQIVWKRGQGLLFNPMKQQGINPQYIQVAQIMQGFLEDLAGGRSFQGLSEGANESGRAIIAKQKQGMLVASMFLDNLARWKQSVGERILEYACKYESSETMIKFTGAEVNETVFNVLRSQDIFIPSQTDPQTAGYIKLPNGLKFLKDMKYELTVSETELNENLKNQRFMQLLSLNQVYPNAIPIDILLEYFDIPYSVKQKIVMRSEQEAQRQAQLAQMQAMTGQQAGGGNAQSEAQSAVANVYNDTQRAMAPEEYPN